MAKKITKIKASDSSEDKDEKQASITRKKVVIKDKKQVKANRKATKKVEKEAKKAEKAKSNKKVFILFRPFVAFGRYIRDSWREIRQVRWPNRKATWKMVLAVIIYTALFVALISLLDLFFTWLFSLIIK
ncbi:preprotein translocase subunit SecE [Candidatus Saccharibacteria bacterium]|nr:preprotein translocase subunit SecE [Candidatus Saccharibacteria bacterium]MBR3254285.1 preprotein translocase subunit SecE [Candidatus Saccharibacteria bacterium]